MLLHIHTFATVWFKSLFGNVTQEDTVNAALLLAIGMVTLVALMAILMLVAVLLSKATKKKSSEDDSEES